MRQVIVVVLLFASAITARAAERPWQTGKWVDIGVSRNPFVGDPRASSPSGLPGPLAAGKGSTPQVGRYVIEDDVTRFTIEDIIPLGGQGSFDVAVKIGDRVTFAVVKNNVYIRGDGVEYRLRLVKKEQRPASP